MARTANTPAQPAEAPEILPQAAADIIAGQSLAAAAQDAARELALQLSYDGALTVGALEDEIRFYQRRSVEALLETGKRLLLLKELTPHGEFMPRVELLGFSRSTAQRFMQAAMKVSKLPNLGNLASEMKSASAFLELITADDDVIEKAIGELDAIDRMSASELRAKLRDTKADLAAAGERIEVKNQVIDRLERAQQRIAALPPDEAMQALHQEAAGVGRDVLGRIQGYLRAAIQAVIEADVAAGNGERSSELFCAALVGAAMLELTRLRDEFDLPDVSNARDLQLMREVAEWGGPAAEPAPPQAQEPAAH